MWFFWYNVQNILRKRNFYFVRVFVEITSKSSRWCVLRFWDHRAPSKTYRRNLNVIIHARTDACRFLGMTKKSVELIRLDHSSSPLFVREQDVSQHLRCCRFWPWLKMAWLQASAAFIWRSRLSRHSGKPIRSENPKAKVCVDSTSFSDVPGLVQLVQVNLFSGHRSSQRRTKTNQDSPCLGLSRQVAITANTQNW